MQIGIGRGNVKSSMKKIGVLRRIIVLDNEFSCKKFIFVGREGKLRNFPMK